jgi:hypothetical protein
LHVQLAALCLLWWSEQGLQNDDGKLIKKANLGSSSTARKSQPMLRPMAVSASGYTVGDV